MRLALEQTVVVRSAGAGETVTSLQNLSFDDLSEWAGGTILHRGQAYVQRVEQLSRTPGNELVAWVTGSKRYATSVRISEEGDIDHYCTCPFEWGPCKHAVAVILAAAQREKESRAIPMLDENDELGLAFLEAGDEEEVDQAHSLAPRRSAALTRIEKALGDKSKKELLSVLVELAARYPEVERSLRESEQLAAGQVEKLARALREEIRDLTAEPAWYDHWRGQGDLPDFSHVQQQLQMLLDHGHANTVLQLGEELWTRGNAQVEQSDDEGETAQRIAGCLAIVIAALPQSSLSPSEQLLWVIDRSLDDEYSLLESAEDLTARPHYSTDHWREVAKTLETRLGARPRAAGFSATYSRGGLLNQLLAACDRAGWKERIIPLLEAEADACRCYARLVDALLDAGQSERARHWCIHGYAQTIDDAPGIASDLQERLRNMARMERRHDLVTAYRAQDFFDRPSSASYSQLRKAADKAECWPAVQSAVLHYLETGLHPAGGGRKGRKPRWPLPSPEVEPTASGKRSGGRQFPDIDVLIEIAILEKRLDDVVDLYERQRKTQRWARDTEKSVARAVATSHPDVALSIWRMIVDGLIAQVKPKAYEEAAIYLRSMAKVYSQNHRLSEWQELLSSLRKTHKAKRRLMGVLDSLSRTRIVE